MPWRGTEEQHKDLYNALSEVNRERGMLGRLAAAISEDARAKATEEALASDTHSRKKSLVVHTTLSRWLTGGLECLERAQPLKKRLVFEYLERSADYRTKLFKPEGSMPKGLLSYVAEHAPALSRPFETDLHRLDGHYRVFRPAWTVPELSRERVLISRIQILTNGGFTCFREEQQYTDSEADDLEISEIDYGAVLDAGGNLVFVGLGSEGQRCKLFAVSSIYPYLHQNRPINRFSGTTISVSGDGPHRSFPFVAQRAEGAFKDLETCIVHKSDAKVSVAVLSALQMTRD